MRRTAVTGMAIAAVLAATGCAGTDPLSEDFGESVRHMVRIQTENTSDENARLDGQRGERVMEEYRKPASAPAVPTSAM